jgi:hypothetical protein
MTGIVLSLFFLQAGALPGVVTGIVRSAAGAPTEGVRVYGQQVRDPADATSPAAPLEGLVQTDAAGRYRLELPAGRYFIASGSVSSPTYYPGTADVSSARLITVTSGGVVEGIDFGSFVPAVRSPIPTAILNTPTGILAGTVRFPDGTPAASIRVAAFPQSVPLPPTAVPPGTTLPRPVQTDAGGNYQINSVALGWYYIVAGFREAPGFHTGGAGATQPKAILLTSPTAIGSLDITIPFPAHRSGTTVSGKVLTKDGVPAAGAMVQILAPWSGGGTITGVALPSINAVPETFVGSDGTFTFTNVVPDFYNAQVSFSNANKVITINVGSTPVTGLEFSLPLAILSGRILMEDGTPVRDPELFVSPILTVVSNPNLLISTILPFSAGGNFAGLPDIGKSRFYFRSLPEEYEIRSITAGSVDLTKELFEFDGTKSLSVEVRVARRSASPSPSSVRVVGTVRDGSGVPAAAARVQLCCLHPELMDAISAPIRPDGSFEFVGIPPGKYTPDLRVKTGQSAIKVTNATVEAGSDRVRLQLVSGTAAANSVGTIEIPTVP